MQPLSTVSPRDLLGIVWRRKFVILGCGLLFAIASAAWNSRRPPTYRATARVLVTEPAEPVLSTGEAEESRRIPSLETQIALLGGRAAAKEIASRASRDLKVSPEEVLEGFETEEVKKTSLLAVSGLSPDPRKAAAVANAAAEIFVERNEEFYRARARSALEFVDQQLPTYEEKLRTAERALQLFREASALAQAADGSQRLAEALDAFEAAAQQAEVDLREQQRQATELARELDRENRALADPASLRNNTLIEELKSKLVDAEARYAVARRKYTEKFPNVLPDLKAEIEGLQDRLQSELRKVVSGKSGDLTVQRSLVQQVIEARSRVLGLEARRAALRQVAARYRQQMRDLPSQEQELARLRRAVTVAERLYTSLLESRQQLELRVLQTRGSAQIVERATVPKREEAVGAAANLGFALVFGLVVGIVAALLMEAADRAGGRGTPTATVGPAESPPEPQPEPDLSGRLLRAWWPRRVGFALFLLVAAGGAAAVFLAGRPDPAKRAAGQSALAATGASDRAFRSPASPAAKPGRDESATGVDLTPSLGDLVDQKEPAKPSSEGPATTSPAALLGESGRARWAASVPQPLPPWPPSRPPSGWDESVLAVPGTMGEEAPAESKPASPIVSRSQYAGLGAASTGTSQAAPPDLAASADAAAHRAPPDLSPPPAQTRPAVGGVTDSAEADSARERPSQRPYFLWVGEYESVDAAKPVCQKLVARGWKAWISRVGAGSGAPAYRLEVGAYATRGAAERARDELRAQGHPAHLVYRFSF